MHCKKEKFVILIPLFKIYGVLKLWERNNLGNLKTVLFFVMEIVSFLIMIYK